MSDEQGDREPLVTKGLRPIETRAKEAAGGVAEQHERASQAEEIAGTKQHQNECAAEVHPGEDGRQIFGSESWADEAIDDHRYGGKEQGDLQCGTGMPPTQETADYWNAQEVKTGSRDSGDGRVGRLGEQRVQLGCRFGIFTSRSKARPLLSVM